MPNKVLSIILTALLTMQGLVSPAEARVIDTRDVLAVEARSALIGDIQRKLATADVQQAMVELGVDPAEASLRVASLDDRELMQLDGQLDSLPVGGDVLALIGAVFVVLLILELTGVINIFNRT